MSKNITATVDGLSRCLKPLEMDTTLIVVIDEAAS